MAKKKIKNDEPLVDVGESISKTKEFLQNNQKLLMIIGGSVLAIGIILLIIFSFYLPSQESEAKNKIWMAQLHFESDSLDLALNGNEENVGFEDIANDYSWSNSGNLSRYYLGMIYLKQGEFDLAIENFKKFSTKSKILAPMSLGAIGDAYMELDKLDEAAKYYIKASEKHANDFTSPLFLMKAGWTYELLEDYENALKAYEKIKSLYYFSPEAGPGAREIDKYIARAQAKSGK